MTESWILGDRYFVSFPEELWIVPVKLTSNMRDKSYWQWKTVTHVNNKTAWFNATKNTNANQTSKTIPLDGMIPTPKDFHEKIRWPHFRWVLLYSQFEQQHPFLWNVTSAKVARHEIPYSGAQVPQWTLANAFLFFSHFNSSAGIITSRVVCYATVERMK